MQINGAVDEAQAAIGMARAEAVPGSEFDVELVGLERDLYVLMAEVATDAANRDRLVPGASLVTSEMVAVLEARIDELLAGFELPAEFVVPGTNRMSACLDVARTVVRRAERLAVTDPVPGSEVVRYLNRLSDLLWTMARWAEGDRHLLARTRPRGAGRTGGVASTDDGGTGGVGGTDDGGSEDGGSEDGGSEEAT